MRKDKKRNKYLNILLLLCIGIAIASTQMSCNQSSKNSSVPEKVDTNKITCNTTQGNAVEMASAKLYIEHNASDKDTGVHGNFADNGWKKLCIYDPDGKQILGIKPMTQFGDLTMADIFFESREPPNDEYTIDMLKTDFPEGLYTVRGVSFDGTNLKGTATFTHNIPAEPDIALPIVVKDKDKITTALVSPINLKVEWVKVFKTINGNSVDIKGYEIIITKLDKADPNGFSVPTFDVHVPPSANNIGVPNEFIEANTPYELEVLALEKSGNQTISVGFFQTQ